MFYAAVVVAGVAGAVVLLRRSDPARRGLFLVVVGVVPLVSPLATFGDPRFKMPLYPTLAVCATVAVVAAADRLRPRTQAGPAPDDQAPDDRAPDAQTLSSA